MSPAPKKAFRILAIDGGGIRGIVPGMILTHLESYLKKKTGNDDTRVADHFDLIAGTSTGGIIAAGLLCPAGGTGPDPSTPEELVALYKEHGPEIFKSRGPGFFRPKYSPKVLEENLKAVFGDGRMSSFIRQCLITSYDIGRRETKFFSTYDLSGRNHQDPTDYRIVDIARATSAAPTYFPPLRLPVAATGRSRVRQEDRYLVDGGVTVGNPALSAYAEARKQDRSRPNAGDMAILSLGTGRPDKSYAGKKAMRRGKSWWLRPILDIMMNGSNDVTNHHLEMIFDSVNARNRYLRIQGDLDSSWKHILDDTSPEFISYLEELAESLISAWDKDIRAFTDKYLI